MASINTVTLAGTVRRPKLTPQGGSFYLEVEKFVYGQGYTAVEVPVVVDIDPKKTDSFANTLKFFEEGKGVYVVGKLDFHPQGGLHVRGKPQPPFFGDKPQKSDGPPQAAPPAAGGDEEPPF